MPVNNLPLDRFSSPCRLKHFVPRDPEQITLFPAFVILVWDYIPAYERSVLTLSLLPFYSSLERHPIFLRVVGYGTDHSLALCRSLSFNSCFGSVCSLRFLSRSSHRLDHMHKYARSCPCCSACRLHIIPPGSS